jgi:16S rRNA (cytosine967-C5)-methyltransferase
MDHPISARTQQHMRSFEKALDAFKADMPFSRFLTNFFKENRQMGSKDRKVTTRLLYHFFRLGHAAKDLPRLQRLAMAECLAGGDVAVAQVATPHWVPLWDLSFSQRIDWFQQHTTFRLEALFPCVSSLSSEIDKEAFLKQHFIQPKVYIRSKKSSSETILKILKSGNIAFEQLSDQTFSFPNGTQLQVLPLPKGSYQVQDWSSQRVLDHLTINDGSSWWDACSGSGGKSINLWDRNPSIRLMVSDIRPSILRNLAERFEEAHIGPYRSKVIDMTQGTEVLEGEKFDGILLDVPCTGSGTWGRTPEQLTAFRCDRITYFSSLQRNIASKALSHLKADGLLCYITCSVFTQENEAVIQFLLDHFPLELVQMRYEKGYDQHADTLFVAHLKLKKA